MPEHRECRNIVASLLGPAYYSFLNRLHVLHSRRTFERKRGLFMD